MDIRLNSVAVVKFCMGRGLDVERGSALHLLIAASVDGEAQVLAETVELMDSDGTGSRKSGLKLWSLLKYGFDRLSAFNAGRTPAKAMHDVVSKLALASKDRDFANMLQHGVQVYPEVFVD